MRVSILVLSSRSSLTGAHEGGRLLLCEHVSLPLKILVLLYGVELSQRICEEAEPQRVFNELGFPLKNVTKNQSYQLFTLYLKFLIIGKVSLLC